MSRYFGKFWFDDSDNCCSSTDIFFEIFKLRRKGTLMFICLTSLSELDRRCRDYHLRCLKFILHKDLQHAFCANAFPFCAKSRFLFGKIKRKHESIFRKKKSICSEYKVCCLMPFDETRKSGCVCQLHSLCSWHIVAAQIYPQHTAR